MGPQPPGTGRFGTVLVANRGEIAVRVMRTARRLGYHTVAVHSDADASAPHVAAADRAMAIGPAPASESYLSIEKILDAAQRSGAEAIHPGYGFLSENAAFAEACEEAGIVFIGPRPDAILAMGDKAEAKRRVADAGVPLLAGYNGEAQDEERLLAEAKTIGFPLMVKAAAGGGGKGMRLVADSAALPDALAAARREAKAAFGSETLILERAVVNPRHVEIQILADAHGNVVSLGERDCSVQRRHQKVLEEAPSPAVNEELRERMGTAAVAAARSVSYLGAGTVEFLLDDAGEFHFLEMNTRLQVEHPVTEMVTGFDLVEWQLRIAEGEPLGFGQDEARIDGHAIEARLYAEDPAHDFLPQTGEVIAWRAPEGAGVRVDSGIETGSEIRVHYDPMIAKIIAHGPDRERARARLVRALEETTLLGPAGNRGFLISVLEDERFASGTATTAMLEQMPEPAAVGPSELAAIAAHLYRARREAASAAAPGLAGFSSIGELGTWLELDFDGEHHPVRINDGPAGLRVEVDGEPVELELESNDVITVEALANGRILAHLRRVDVALTDLDALPPSAADALGEGVLLAPMHGAVIAAEAAAGDQVKSGQKLVVMEAMKMEQEVVADIDGTIEEIVAVGTQVSADQVVVRIAPSEG